MAPQIPVKKGKRKISRLNYQRYHPDAPVGRQKMKSKTWKTDVQHYTEIIIDGKTQAKRNLFGRDGMRCN